MKGQAREGARTSQVPPAREDRKGRVKLRELAEQLGCELLGDGEIEIRGAAGLEQAGPGDLSFLANPRYTPLLATTAASAVVVARGQQRGAAETGRREPVPRLRLRRRPPAPAGPARRGSPSLRSGRPERRPGGRRSRGRPRGRGRAGAGGRGHRTPSPRRALRRRGVGEDCLLHSGVQVRERCRIGNRVWCRTGRWSAPTASVSPGRPGPPPQVPAGRHRGDRRRRRDRRPHRDRPRGARRDPHRAAAASSTTWCRSATR